MPLKVDELIERDGPACVWCGREPWLRDLAFDVAHIRALLSERAAPRRG